MAAKVNNLNYYRTLYPARPGAAALLSLLLALLLMAPTPLLAAEEGDCRLFWRCALGGEVLAMSPAGDGRQLYAAVDDRRLYAIDTRGRVLWRTSLGQVPGKELSSAPEGMLTLTTRRKSLLLLNERGGIIWERSLPEGYAGGAVAANGTVFLAGQRELQAISHTGTLRWSRSLPAGPSAAPVFSERYGLLVPGSDGFLRNYQPGGVLRWEFRAAGPPGEPIPRAEGIYLTTAAGTVALVSGEGTLLRQFREPGGSRFSAAAEGMRGILVADATGIYRISADRIEQRVQTELRPLAGSAGEGRIALFGRRGAAKLYDRSGRELGGLRMPPASALPVFFGGGLLAVGGKDWIIYAYRCEKRAASPAGAAAAAGAAGAEQQAELRESEQGAEPAPAVARGAAGVTAAQLMREALLGLGDRELIEELLEKAERVLASREPRPGELEYLRAAEAVLTEGVLNPKFRGGRLINDFPELRGRAAELLGRQGDLGSRRPLFELLQYEWAAGGVGKSVDALGRLGGVGSGEGIAFLLGRLQAGGSAIGDGLATKMIDYVGREFRYHGIVRRDAVELLQAIYLGEFGRAVRLKAVETLRGLKRDA